MKKMFLVSLLLISVNAYAQPVYLNCSMSNGSTIVDWKVSLDESAGTASYTIPDMNVVQKYPAVFVTDKVTFGSIEISRIDLTMKRTLNLMGKIISDSGKCKIADAQPRKF